MTTRITSLLLFAIAICLAAPTAPAAEAQPLWEIGKPDGSDAEFALAPGGSAKFKNDGFFVVGESDARRDWPYVHPGPQDGWAGSVPHTFTILFGLKAAPPADGECRLDVHLIDTHSKGPPALRIEINGQPFDRDMPKGGGDESIAGRLSKAKPFQFSVPFSAKLLKAGDNEIRITTVKGSWILYDWLGLVAPAGVELARVSSHTVVEEVKAVRALREVEGRLVQPVVVRLRHFGPEADATITFEGQPAQAVRLARAAQTVEALVPAVTAAASLRVNVEAPGEASISRTIALTPVPRLTVYVLPHSHNDIGFTEIQTAIEKKQVNNLVEGIAIARRTASYPPGARFVWNMEVLWAADLYLHRLDEQQRALFLDAVRDGQVVLNGMYLNELTGLCRPEELIRLCRFGTKLADVTGKPIDSAMISDVPGYTWGTVTALSQAGIRYFSVAPNYFDRIGTIMREWENKPFYWVGPDGKTEVLVWVPFWGYAMSHRYGTLSPRLVDDLLAGLEKQHYPYEIAAVRWSGHGDNAAPDPMICDAVRDWNAQYVWPHFIISGTGEAFRAFEQRYGDKLPRVRGDWTPYWEDGAGSSALETAMNRQSSDRLAQAETLFAMLKADRYPATIFEEAWNHVLLYSEHTWGAYCSISKPESDLTRDQWEIKRGHAVAGDRQSRELLAAALADRPPAPSGATAEIDVYNTASWARTALALVPADLSTAGDHVSDDAGRPVPSQRLTSGDLALLARDVPPFTARRYTISSGEAYVPSKPATAAGNVLDNGPVRVRVDDKSGGIVELTAAGIDGNFADTSGGEALNDYLYLPGDDLKDLRRNGPVALHAGEKGPLVASLVAEGDAPGCKRLRREIRVVAGMDHVELFDLVDKARLQAADYHAKEGKESVNFAFPFNVPDGRVTLDVPLGLVRVEADQMPSACKNWLTVGRFVDVSSERRGITWVTLDAPLVEVGGITARLLNSQTDPDVWRKTIEPTQKLYSWVMNNHWGTNYRAYQEGPTLFRFVLRPHGTADLAESSRFATGFSQPLLAVRASGLKAPGTPLLRVEPSDVLVTALKPTDDGKGWIVRLFNVGSQEHSATLIWPGLPPGAMSLSGTGEHRGAAIGGPVAVPPRGLVTVRVERGS